ncbi:MULTISPECIES: radical SAM family heme chaperone HemW [unclassified Minwuia]|jgi:putative oxygen-independent coproporphyrinogen III oxidase|uniref:radical SAM family heme chaperone HemW n=1 Tax=unclassified Minwuia TaxID=2618799 RepID=UPI00247ADC5A|nr:MULTISPECIES: radical SAM family heme chaperone HemW [unclassified Minwuia]
MKHVAAPAFGVYVHWPFCVSKCPYCDFNSHVRETVDQDRWRAALLAEIRAWAERVPKQAVDTVFLGGGTPSLMPPATVAAVLAQIDDSFGLAADVEITLEANPSSIEVGRFRDFRSAGVNRVSLGVQSLDDRALRFLGRAHDAEAAKRGIAVAASAFDRFSFDLIYALPDQTEAEWRAMLAAALDLAGDHLSLYQLTIEPNTGFAGQVKRGVFDPMDDDRAADLFELTAGITADAGLPAYETSNHARPGGECRHNLLYWQYGSWIGVGPGAHGRPVSQDGQRHATANHRKPEAWLEAVEAGGTALAEARALPTEEQAEEALMMGLRLADGIAGDMFQARTGGQSLDRLLDPTAAHRLTEDGLIETINGTLRVHPRGRLLLNSITGALLGG